MISDAERNRGFDVVLGNPPWERVKLQEQEFFASRSREIAGAVNAAARKKLIAKLPAENPRLWTEWCAASREAEGESHFIRQSGRYPLCGKGDVNTYAIFAEHNRALLHSHGRAGFIVPPGLATDDTTKAYFQELVEQNALIALYEFENEEFLFPGIDHRVRFILITVAQSRAGESHADIAFGSRNVAALGDSSRHFSLTPADFLTLNPNTRTCPTFRSHRDATINLAMYRRAGILWPESHDEIKNPWQLRFMRMFDMAGDSGFFRTRNELHMSGLVLKGNQFVGKVGEFAPLVEAKMVHHYDHRWGTYQGQTQAQKNMRKLPEFDEAAHADPSQYPLPEYWVDVQSVVERLEGHSWNRGWLLGWRDITRNNNVRTLISSLIPRAAVGDKFLLMMSAIEPRLVACLYGSLCSFALDYAARQKVGGTSFKYFTMRQLPVLAPKVYSLDTPWQRESIVCAWLLPRVLELTYTAWDLEPFARDVGYVGPPLRWDTARRFLIRCELDAAFFHLYGLSRDDSAYLMDSFPIVRKNDEKNYGEYRTKRVILEIYDAMAEAARIGKPYQTRLDPPPADVRVAHADTRSPAPSRVEDFSFASLGSLPDEAWRVAEPLNVGNIGVAVAAALKRRKDSRSANEMRMAVLLAVEPRLLLPHLNNSESKAWRRLIGTDANPLSRGVQQLLPPVNAAWGEAIRHLRGNNMLLENLVAGTWAPGPRLREVTTEGWADGRLAFVLHILDRVGLSQVEVQLPQPYLRLVRGEAA